jgi:hypothetical protein
MRDGTKILRYIFAVLMLVLPMCMKAQQDTILLNRDTTITTCNMMLYDSGGKYGNYSNNENYILKVCGTGTVGMVNETDFHLTFLYTAMKLITVFFTAPESSPRSAIILI